MVSTIPATKVLTPGGFVGPAAVVFDHGLIVGVEPVATAPDRIVAPGFVDLQVNGIGSVHCATADGDDWQVLDQHLLAQGTTSWCPTLVSAPLDRYTAALDRIAVACDRRSDTPHPSILGVHLEGPFLAVPGAHPPRHLRAIDRAFLDGLPSHVRIVTLAPEVEGAADATAALAARGITVSIGHTRSSHGEFAAVTSSGASMVTHLFNAMSGVHHREGGVALWALSDPDLVVSLIADGVHVDPLALRLAFTAKTADGVALVTDAVAVNRGGFGGRSIMVVDGAPRLSDGTLAGSVLTMDQAVRTCVDAGVALEEALIAASRTPARAVGALDRGAIAAGLRADLVVLDTSLRVAETWVGGVRSPGTVDAPRR